MASVYRIKRKSKQADTRKSGASVSAELLTDLDLSLSSAPMAAEPDGLDPLAEIPRREQKKAVEETAPAPVEKLDPQADFLRRVEEEVRRNRADAEEQPAEEPIAAEEPTVAEEPAVAAEEPVPEEAKPEAEPAPEEEAKAEAEPAPQEEEKAEAEPAPQEEAKAEAVSYDEELVRQLEEEERTRQDLANLPGLKHDEIDFAKLDAVFGHSKGNLSAEDGQQGFDETTALLMQVFGTDSDKKKKKKKEKEAEKAAQPEEILSVFQEEAPAEETATEEAAMPAAEDAPSVDETQAFSAVKAQGEYVAIHDSAEESTREYSSGLSDLPEIGGGAGVPHPVPPMAEELRVPDQESPYNDTYDEIENNGKNHLEILPEEYTSRDQYDEFAEHLRNKNFRSLVNCLWLFLMFGLVFYLESATFSNLYHPEVLKPGGTFNVIFLLVDVQLIFISALFQLSSLGNGIKALFTGKANRNSITFLAMLFSVIHAVLLIVFPAEGYYLFGCVALLFALLNGIAEFLDNKRLYRTFRISASRHTKFVGEEVAPDSAESEALQEIHSGEQKVYTVQRAELVEDFFKRAKETPKSQGIYGWTIFLSFAAAVAFAVYRYLQAGSVTDTIASFMTMMVMTLPLCGIFTQTLPQARISQKAEKKDAAIVSLAAAERCTRASVVSFTDKEIFPAKFVKVTTIRTYGLTRIDTAILYAAMIFQKLGGPLSQVFKKTISGVYSEIPEDFDFQEITADGMSAKLDGKDVFVGNKDYMLSYDFGYTKDSMDQEFEDHCGKIMYMVIGSELAAKFYIRYSVSSRFRKTIVSLYKTGICPAVKTCDPNIDTNLLQNLLKSDKIPAGVIKTTDAMKDAPVLDKSRSGVVCTASIAGLLQTFVLCDSLRHLVRINAVIKILSLLIGAGVVVFLTLMGNFDRIDTLFAMIYQLLWLVPVFIPNILE